MLLVIGNRNYSSWSLRAWLGMAQARLDFQVERIALFEPGYKARILARSPAGKVPVLVDGPVTVWESLAIGEYLHDRFPDRGIWPADPVARAHARVISAEMHAGFSHLRARMPMNLRATLPGRGRSPEVDGDVERVQAIWQDCLVRSDGPFLFGRFCWADAMYAPVATRFITYGVPLAPAAQAYVQALRALPTLAAWYAEALTETEVIEEDEPYR